MKATKVFLIAILISPLTLFAQENENIRIAKKFGGDRNFFEAIEILKNEIKKNPENADAYYWLARYSHYIVYDSRPFLQKGNNWSNTQVLNNLNKAVQLNPQLGDAYYFLAVEYGARAREALRSKNIKQAKTELIKAKNSGGFPLYVLEYAKNILNACDKNAILFVAGDGIFNAILYLQLIERVRQDVSLISLGLLEQPYYVKLIRDGIQNEIIKVPISWTDDLIMEIHDYPWKEQEITVHVAKPIQKKYSLNDVRINVPDWGGALYNMSAAALNILETNKWKRPIYTAFSEEERSMFLFNDYLQEQGFVSELMPYKVKDSINQFDNKKFESQILNLENYKYFHDINIHNQPRINYFFADNRREQIIKYIQHLIEIKDFRKAKEILIQLNKLMPDTFFPFSNESNEKLKKISEQLK